MTMWQRGHRLFSTAAVLMILTAAAHTAGNLASGPPDLAEQRLFEAMRNHKVPLGMGMNPSVHDIYWDLVFTMSITFAALGSINLVLASGPGADRRLLRRVSWANAVWIAAFLILNAVFRIPPALISAGIIELVVIAYLLASKRATSA